MFLFERHGRIQKTLDGIQFYEQDILLSEYEFSGDQRIEINIDYISPGFGLAILEKTESGLKEEQAGYLIKLGNNDFRIFHKKFGQQKQLYVSSCSFMPNKNTKNIILVFELKDKQIFASKKEMTSEGNEREFILGTYKLPKTFASFSVGLYSNAGNTIRSVYFLNKVPPHWRISTKNTMGGRICFRRNTIQFENCEHHAEVEQKNILLKPGKYWLKYETDKVRGKNDIKPYILYPVDLNVKKQCNFEDDNKNLLDGKNTFTLKEETLVNLKFKAHDGIVRNIAITDNSKNDFVETGADNSPQKGSEIIIKLKGLKSVLWEAVIYDVPPWEDLSQKCPYAVLESKDIRYNMQDLEIVMRDKYRFIYDVAGQKLTILNLSHKKAKAYDKMILSVENIITIMKNLTSTITKLVLTSEDGSSIDLMLRKTFKKYVSSATTSPIIVTHDEEPFDISAAYREVVIPRNNIALYSREKPLLLKEDSPVNSNRIKVYGINRGATINVKAYNIDEFTDKYEIISDDNYTRTENTVDIPNEIRTLYDYIAIEYKSIKDFFYEFTNYEREIFGGKMNILSLEKPLAKRNEDIVLYAIPQDSIVHEKYLYRVPSVSLMNSIDYYADRYDIVPPDLYRVNFNENEIVVSDRITDGRYKKFIVDYLKRDSYTINYREQYSQYEVNITAENDLLKLHHDIHEDGSMYDYIRTKILPDKDKYVILKPREEP